MPTASEPYTTYEQGWIVRIQPPKEAPPARSLLLLHGWKGDETVMWIFTRNFPGNTWMFSPRAPVHSPDGGYGWLPHAQGKWPALQDFAGVAGDLYAGFRTWSAGVHAPVEPLDVMGFSQGAAMAYALAAYYPEQIHSVIALAGFLPPDADTPGRYRALSGKKIYIAHGTKDETVPVLYAQEAVKSLQAVGAQVTYCESDAGHKLSAACFKGLENFLRA